MSMKQSPRSLAWGDPPTDPEKVRQLMLQMNGAVETLKELSLLPSEIRRLGGIEQVRKDNPDTVVRVRRMIQP